MAVIRTVRYTTDPNDATEMVAARGRVVTATRESYPGLVAARLSRIDEQTWSDAWHWESAEQMHAAVNAAATIPGVGEAFAMISLVGVEVSELVDEA